MNINNEDLSKNKSEINSSQNFVERIHQILGTLHLYLVKYKLLINIFCAVIFVVTIVLRVFNLLSGTFLYAWIAVVYGLYQINKIKDKPKKHH